MGRRGRVWTPTTGGDDRLDRPTDLAEHRSRAPDPNRLCVADLTYVKLTMAGSMWRIVVDMFSHMVVG